jgi:TolB-like protein
VPAVIGSLFSELRRRRVLRTLALYILSAWGLMQVADVMLPALSLPESTIRYVLLAAIAGFPVALVFGWFFDVTADGIRRTPALAAADSHEPSPLRTADYLLLGALLLVLGLIGYGVLQNADELNAALPPENRAVRGDGPPMIAVLPFDFLGGSEDGEFFAAGVHDDLLNRLAQVKGLRVISRTSMLEYADTAKSVVEIGDELAADAVLEGGIRIAGGQIRVNVQLIDAHADNNLWAQTYDRQLSADNIFAVQSDIARAIAAALQTSLSEADEAQLAQIPTSNLAAYRAFHEAMRFQEETSPGSSDYQSTFEAKLEKAIALDSRFTRPMMELAGAIARVNFRTRNPQAIERIEGLVTRIGEVEPGSADHLTAQAYYFYYIMHEYDRADELIDSARAKSPSDTRLLEIQSWIKRRKGDFDGFVATTRLASELKPSDKGLKARLIYRLLTVHRYDEARQVAATIEQADLRLLRLIAELDFIEHRSISRYRDELAAHLGEGEPGDQISHFEAYWNVLLADRDFTEAARIAEAIVALSGTRDSADALAAEVNFLLILPVLQGDRDQLALDVAALKQRIGTDSLSDTDILKSPIPAYQAMLLIMDGKTAEAREMLTRYLSRADHSPTELFFILEPTCQALGLSGAAAETVQCLRQALSTPSSVMPYMEPRLPYYDPIRDSAEFQALVGQLTAEGWL